MTTIYQLVTIGLVALAAAVPKPSGNRGISPRIYKGHDGKPIPYQVLLTLRGSDGMFSQCGGSLISQFYVLTAAHCLQGVTEVNVTLGTYEAMQNQNTQIVKDLEDIIICGGFKKLENGSTVNDIGLIKLPQPVLLSGDIKLISLPSRNDIGNNYIGEIALVSGWGSTNFRNDGSSQVLKYATVKVIRNFFCDREPQDYSILCTTPVDGASCKGDSGGPLVDVFGVQIGIVSYQSDLLLGFCLLENTVTYTRIAYYLDWIEANSDVKIR